jgi:HSP20 family protein
MERLARLRQEAERIVAELFAGAPSTAVPESGPRVPVDIFEDLQWFRLFIEVPGVSRADLALFVVGGSLVVEGRKREALSERGAPDRVAFECAERNYGSFRRVLDLPGAADTSRVEARLNHGVLEIKLPRIRERRGGRREVSIE